MQSVQEDVVHFVVMWWRSGDAMTCVVCGDVVQHVIRVVARRKMSKSENDSLNWTYVHMYKNNVRKTLSHFQVEQYFEIFFKKCLCRGEKKKHKNYDKKNNSSQVSHITPHHIV